MLRSMGLQRVRHDWATELNLLWVLCLRASEVGFLGWALCREGSGGDGRLSLATEGFS